MPVDLNDLLAYRIIHISNLEYILKNGIYYRNSPHADPQYVNIGSADIISRRDSIEVPIGGTVNDYVPFYLGMRSPMLLKIKTGHGVKQYHQSDIIYICCQVRNLMAMPVWCFTDGNAATSVTSFFTDGANLDELDWVSIYAENWKAGADNDPDRLRKKQAEFLVRDHVPVHVICKIIVLNEPARQRVRDIIDGSGLVIPIEVNPNGHYYYN